MARRFKVYDLEDLNNIGFMRLQRVLNPLLYGVEQRNRNCLTFKVPSRINLLAGGGMVDTYTGQPRQAHQLISQHGDLILTCQGKPPKWYNQNLKKLRGKQFNF